jgi:arsenite oxidase large subunit
MVKVAGAQQPISWEAAIEIMAETIGYAKETWGGPAMAIRFYAYQYYENTYPITKFYFGDVGTPNGAIHNRASMGGETTALGDIGLETWGTAYDDGMAAQTVVAWGANLYECQDVYFAEHIVPGGAPLITVDPRKTFTAVYGESVGGVHLQLVPGTDVVLAGALARHILGQGWEDAEFVAGPRRRTTSPRKMPGAARRGRCPSRSTSPTSWAWTPTRWKTRRGSPAFRPRRSGRRPS